LNNSGKNGLTSQHLINQVNKKYDIEKEERELHIDKSPLQGELIYFCSALSQPELLTQQSQHMTDVGHIASSTAANLLIIFQQK